MVDGGGMNPVELSALLCGAKPSQVPSGDALLGKEPQGTVAIGAVRSKGTVAIGAVDLKGTVAIGAVGSKGAVGVILWFSFSVLC